MLETIRLSIPGKPRPKARPRAGQFGFFTPKETEAEEAFVRQLGSKAMQGRSPSVGPMKVSIEAVFDFPASWPSRVKEMRNLPHVSTPDLDNIAKLILDALNGIVYADDGQICELVLRKRYGEGQRVEVVIEELAVTVDHPAIRRARKREDEERITPRTARRKPKRRAAPVKKEPVLGKRIR